VMKIVDLLLEFGLSALSKKATHFNMLSDRSATYSTN